MFQSLYVKRGERKLMNNLKERESFCIVTFMPLNGYFYFFFASISPSSKKKSSMKVIFFYKYSIKSRLGSV